MKHRCIKTGLYDTRAFTLCKLFIESEGNVLDIEINMNLAIQLSRGRINPANGFVIFINGMICTSVYQIFRAYEEQGLLQC